MSGRTLAEMARGLTSAHLPDNGVTAAKLADNAVGAAALDPSVTPVTTKRFESAAIDIEVGGEESVGHGLGAIPKNITCLLKCVTAELGYSVDDQVIINPATNDANGSASRGISTVLTATDIKIRFGSYTSALSIINKGTGAAGSITNENWKLIIWAEA